MTNSLAHHTNSRTNHSAQQNVTKALYFTRTRLPHSADPTASSSSASASAPASAPLQRAASGASAAGSVLGPATPTPTSSECLAARAAGGGAEGGGGGGNNSSFASGGGAGGAGGGSFAVFERADVPPAPTLHGARRVDAETYIVMEASRGAVVTIG